MKKRNLIRRFASLAVLVALIVCLAGCVQPYTTLEEYAAHEPLPEDVTHMTMDMDGMHIKGSMEMHDNTVVYKFVLSKIIFGTDQKLDSIMRASMDQYYDKVDNQRMMTDLIKEISQATGIDSSLISIKIEVYNPGADTPSYTYTYSEK